MLGAQGTLALDANLGSGSGDQITGVTAGNVSPTIHLAGGRLLLNLASSGSALSTVNLLTAPLILGAFASVDGLVIDADPINPSVVDVEILTETPSGLDEVNLVPVDPSKVMVGAANLADVFDFAGVGNTTHYLGDSSAFNQSDLILAVGFGHTAYGAVGNDTFELASMDFKRIDGGAGIDTVVLPATGAVDNEGFIHFDFRMTLDGQGFWGMSMDRVEVLDLNDGSSATRHRIHLDADAIAALNDGGNALLDGDSGLVVRGTLGDRVDLYGDFEFVEDTFLAIPELSLDPNSAGATSIEGEVVVKVTQVSHLGQSLLFDESIFVVVHQSNGGKSLFGTDSGETLTGTDFGESIYGREGDDVIDALAGVDQNFGGDGSDSIVFDANDSLVDGGLGIDTLLVTGSIDLSNLNGLGAGAPLANMEIISMAGNESADALNLDMADMLDWVGDNSLDALVGENNYRVFVVRGDADDQLSLDGVDITLLQATQSDIDLFGEGELFTLYRDDALGIDLYVSQAMLATLDAAVVEDPEVMPLTATSILEDFAPIAADASGWS